LNKKLLRLLIASLLFISSFSFAQTGSQYLYVEIRGLSANRGVPELKKELQSINSIRSIEYCENAGLLIIETSSPVDSVRSNVNRLLHSLNYKYEMKSAIPIEEAHRICNRKSN
jgi:hypothetical protein